MIPLVGLVKELKDQKSDRRSRRRRGDEGAGRQDQVSGRHDDRDPARRGHRRTRSPPRREFFSFGTNDLDPADLRLLARRRRQVPEDLHGPEDPRSRIRSRRSTPSASARWWRWASSADARRGPTSSSASAASTAATRRRSTSSTRSASTTSARRRTGSCRAARRGTGRARQCKVGRFMADG